MRRIPMHMHDWITKLDGFLSLNDREILTNAGTISHELAAQHAESHYEAFRQQRSQEEVTRLDEIERIIPELPKARIAKDGDNGDPQ